MGKKDKKTEDKDSVANQLEIVTKELQYEKEISEQTSKDKAKIQRDYENEKKLRHADSIRHQKEKNELEFKLMQHQEVNNMDESGSDSDSDNELEEENEELKAENQELKSRIYELEQANKKLEKEF